MSGREIARAALGAVFGIAAAGVALAALRGGTPAASLIAPLGASAVLLFAVPASPLAQPYAVLGGNLLAGLIGVTMALAIPLPIAAAAMAVGLTLAAMALLRCVHPPSGAVALLAVIGGPRIASAGYWFVATPLMADTLILVIAAMIWNNLWGRSYPHLPGPVAKTATLPRVAPTVSDIEAILAEHGDALTIDPGDLVAIHGAIVKRFEGHP